MLKYNIKHENHDPCFFSGGCGARGEAQRGRDSGGTRQKGKKIQNMTTGGENTTNTLHSCF